MADAIEKFGVAGLGVAALVALSACEVENSDSLTIRPSSIEAVVDGPAVPFTIATQTPGGSGPEVSCERFNGEAEVVFSSEDPAFRAACGDLCFDRTEGAEVQWRAAVRCASDGFADFRCSGSYDDGEEGADLGPAEFTVNCEPSGADAGLDGGGLDGGGLDGGAGVDAGEGVDGGADAGPDAGPPAPAPEGFMVATGFRGLRVLHEGSYEFLFGTGDDSVGGVERMGAEGYLVYGAGQAVPGLGNTAYIVVSPDGRSYQDVSPPPEDFPSEVVAGAAGNGVLVVVTRDDGMISSSDGGATWAAPSVPPPGSRPDVTFGDGVFVTSTGARSTDGDTWTLATTPPENTEAIGFGDGRFVATGFVRFTGSFVYYSTDGALTWTQGTSPNGDEARAVVYGDGTWVIVDRARVWRSTDGVNFVDVTPSDFGLMWDIAYRPGEGFLAVGFKVWSSADGLTWTELALPDGVFSVTGALGAP